MLIYGLISPHPPIILPEVGGPELPRVHKTIQALEQAAAELAAARPEELIIISPHEGHGFEVPEYYLGKHLPDDLPVERILVTEPSYQYYFDFGRGTGERVQRARKRYAVVASGDLSHVLKNDGPYGFNAAGPMLDKIIVKAVRKRDARTLLAIDPNTLDEGAECGLRSILFLLGALDGLATKTNVLSYEGPFGVGYMVATFAPEPADGTTNVSITGLARESIRHYLETGKLMHAPKDLPQNWRQKAGAFVSLHDSAGELRGCIGTIAPAKHDLAAEVIANAVAAATQDPRFAPITWAELENLRASVDVLSPPVIESDPAKLNPKQYGVIVTASDGRQGVLLPDLEGVDTVAEQIAICRQKAGIAPHEPITIRRFEVQRYQPGP